jgi:hypothetical protein
LGCVLGFGRVQYSEMTVKKDNDKRRLRDKFYLTYDEGRISDQLNKLAAGQPVGGLSFIGEGMHFQCWREKKAKDGMELVLKVAKNDFLTEIGNFKAWVAGVNKLPLGIDLMPPIAFVPLRVGTRETLGLAMPYGPDEPGQCSSWWQPMEEQLKAFRQGLKLGGLTLGDIPQIRSWEGIPFIVDISDVRAL